MTRDGTQATMAGREAVARLQESSWNEPCEPARLAYKFCSFPRRGQRPRISRTAQSRWIHMQRLRNRTSRGSHKRLILMSKRTPGAGTKADASPWLCPENFTTAPEHKERWNTCSRATHNGTRGSTLCEP